MAHQKKLKEDLRSIWIEWSTPHDWGLWQDNPKPTIVATLVGGGDASQQTNVGADAGGAQEMAGAPAPTTPAMKPKGGGGAQKSPEASGGGGGGGVEAPEVPGFKGYTPSKLSIQLARQVNQGTATKETLVARLKNVSIDGAKVAGAKAVALATALTNLVRGAVQAVGQVVAPPALPSRPPRSGAPPPAKRAASVKPLAAPSQAPPPAPAPAPPAPVSSRAPTPAANAARKLKDGVRITQGGYYMLGGKRIPKGEAYE